jgi:LacI family transcriptional regulator
MLADAPKVALLIETSREYGRAMLRGVIRYARLHGPWRFYLTPGDFEQALPQMKRWGGTGIIARVETAKRARSIAAAGLPTIVLDVSESLAKAVPAVRQFSTVSSDSIAAAALAAEHLLQRGFLHYAFVGEPDRIWSELREEGFRRRLAAAGYEPIVYKPPRSGVARSWEREQAFLAKWLQSLPRPISLMACNDDRGRQVLEACRIADLVVPMDVAVIGVDNDELLCELSDPPLTSVAMNAEAGGYRAASLLDEMMRGKVKRQRLQVEPLHVVERRSTEATAVLDADVSEALQVIHHHASDDVRIDDIANRLQVSRRTLELKFRCAIGRTPHEELQRVRLARAQRLLLETDYPIPKVAAMAGYGSGAYLAQVFNLRVGQTPAQYRRAHRT